MVPEGNLKGNRLKTVEEMTENTLNLVRDDEEYSEPGERNQATDLGGNRNQIV